MMEYRLCICVDERKGKSAFAVYNQQDFCVYRRVIDSLESDYESEYVRVCETALAYFKRNIRSRYYTEHFSELLDEDRGVVLCTLRELADAFSAYRNEKKAIPEKYALLREQFDIPTVFFEYTAESPQLDRTKELIK
ncbi:MAG: hypothetical protein IJE84_02890 [Clostridia bacterium]|nr:hypothetical protein [Clostridia bacterium]